MSILFWLLIIGGIFCFLIETFVPGGIFGAFGGGALLFAIFLAFKSSTTTGYYTICGLALVMMAMIPMWIWLWPKSPVGKRVTLNSKIEGSGTRDQSKLQGAEGETLTDLGPSGMARIGGKRIDVVSESGWITAGTPVSVCKVQGNRIVVKKLQPIEQATT